MPLTIMGWNVENFGATKYKVVNGGPELVKLIAAVIRANGADIVGLSEIRSNLGYYIGRDLVTELGTATWKQQASQPFGKGRLEQYLMLWNTATADTYQPFETAFANPAPPPATLGFPRQSALDRPPFVGYFESKGPGVAKRVAVAIMHSPAPKPPLFPQRAGQALAKVARLRTEADTCVLLGDFNVVASARAGVAGAPGQAAFGDLVKKPGFEQLLDDDAILTSLIPSRSAWQGMTVDDCLSQPYDQIFARTAPGITFSDEGVDQLITETVSPAPPPPPAVPPLPPYLSPLLAALAGANTGAIPAGYPTVEQAFVDLRYYVSDHLPVGVKVNW